MLSWDSTNRSPFASRVVPYHANRSTAARTLVMEARRVTMHLELSIAPFSAVNNRLNLE